MNRILPILLLSLFAFSIISCSSDDDGAPATGNLIGSWKLHKLGGVINGEEIWVSYESECPTQADKVEFAANHTIKVYTYELDCSLDFAEGTWEFSNNIISTAIDGYEESVEVLLLSETTLRYKSLVEGENMLVELKRL